VEAPDKPLGSRSVGADRGIGVNERPNAWPDFCIRLPDRQSGNMHTGSLV